MENQALLVRPKNARISSIFCPAPPKRGADARASERRDTHAETQTRGDTRDAEDRKRQRQADCGKGEGTESDGERVPFLWEKKLLSMVCVDLSDRRQSSLDEQSLHSSQAVGHFLSPATRLLLCLRFPVFFFLSLSLAFSAWETSERKRERKNWWRSAQQAVDALSPFCVGMLVVLSLLPFSVSSRVLKTREGLNEN